MQMVGVAQHDLRADILQILCRQAALDGTCGGNVLEGRGLYRAVHGLKFAPPGVVFLLEQGVGCQRRHGFSFLRTENSRAASMQAVSLQVIRMIVAALCRNYKKITK